MSKKTVRKNNIFKNKNILVTGGTGSIGLEIVKQLMRCQPKVIRILARHEDRHHQMMQELDFENSPRNNDLLRFIVGDVRDKERLRLAMEDIDIVFHAAALKHVPMCEYNPFEAVKTNILGTQNVIDLARELDVEKVIAISTDKVVDPTGVLGASKLMGEKLVLATFYYQGNRRTKFACVRFGNVLGSRGSILPVVKKQILENGTVTLTDPEMTRFAMTVPQAVNLVLRAARLTQGQEVFVLKMPAFRVEDLVRAAIQSYAPLVNKKPSDIKLKVIGKRNGEKRHEKLLAEHELEHALEIKDLYVLTPFEKLKGFKYRKYYAKAVKVSEEDKRFSSKYAPRLSYSELISLIKKIDPQVV